MSDLKVCRMTFSSSSSFPSNKCDFTIERTLQVNHSSEIEIKICCYGMNDLCFLYIILLNGNG